MQEFVNFHTQRLKKYLNDHQYNLHSRKKKLPTAQAKCTHFVAAVLRGNAKGPANVTFTGGFSENLYNYTVKGKQRHQSQTQRNTRESAKRRGGNIYTKPNQSNIGQRWHFSNNVCLFFFYSHCNYWPTSVKLRNRNSTVRQQVIKEFWMFKLLRKRVAVLHFKTTKPGYFRRNFPPPEPENCASFKIMGIRPSSRHNSRPTLRTLEFVVTTACK